MTTDTYDRKRISQEFASYRVGVTPTAAERIASTDDPQTLIEIIGDTLDDDVRTVDVEHVEEGQERLDGADDDSTESDGLEESPEPVAEPHPDETGETVEPSEEESDSEEPIVEPTIEHVENDGDETETPSENGVGTVVLEEAELDESDSQAPREVTGDDEGVRYVKGGPLISGETPESRWPDAWEKTLVETPLPEAVPRSTDHRHVDVDGDITGKSRTTGEYEDFQRLFRDRYKRLRKILEGRMPSTTNISSLDDRLARRGKPVSIIGIVNEVRKTKNGHDLIELEDTTGTFPVLFSKDHTPDPIKDQIERIIPDEVLGIRGSLSDDAGIMFADEIYFPDLPPMRIPNTSNRSVKAVLLSDLHFGAIDFAAEEWHQFVEWMRTDPEASDVEYILIAGDIVEGIGVYPGQENELDVVDIYDQYVLCAEALKQLPDDVDIYTIMGNHDTVRLAEPQPVIKEAFKEPFADNVHFAGNPATVTVEGVKFLLYHGMSLNPFTDRTPGLDIHEPTDAMQMMLEKRHLAPMYGMNVRLAPENEDYLVIEDVPDVLHTGHVHTFGVDTYKNVLMLNTGCWQYQTDFQKKLNVEPDVGYAPVIDLETLNVEVKKF